MARPHLSEEERTKFREKISDVALALYREGGLNAISMREIAARLGVGPSTLYNYFTNQRALLEHLWREPVAEYEARVRRRVARVDDPIRRIEIVHLEFVRFARENPEIYRGACMYVPQGPLETSDVPFYRWGAVRISLEAVREAQARGLIRECDPVMVTQALWSAVHGAIALPVNMSMLKFRRFDTSARFLLNTVLEGLKP